MRPSISPSQAGVVWKRLDESSWFLARRLSSTYPTLCCKEIWVSPKITVLSYGTLSQTSDLENFATASCSPCQQNSSSTVELVDDTCTTVDESWLFTTRQSTVTLQLHHCDLLWICRTTCFCSRQDFDWHSVLCGSLR